MRVWATTLAHTHTHLIHELGQTQTRFDFRSACVTPLTTRFMWTHTLTKLKLYNDSNHIHEKKDERQRKRMKKKKTKEKLKVPLFLTVPFEWKPVSEWKSFSALKNKNEQKKDMKCRLSIHLATLCTKSVLQHRFQSFSLTHNSHCFLFSLLNLSTTVSLVSALCECVHVFCPYGTIHLLPWTKYHLIFIILRKW